MGVSKRKKVDKKPNAAGEPSTIEPIPYTPNLKRQLGSVFASILFTYLEIHHPAPQDEKPRISSLPVDIDMDTIARDLQVSRRTLQLSFPMLACWFSSERERVGAQSGGKEFFTLKHSQYPKYKPYSLVGSKAQHGRVVLQLRRNAALVAKLLDSCASPRFPSPQQAIAPTEQPPQTPRELPAQSEACATVLPARTLAEIMLRASVLDGDRRAGRHERERSMRSRKEGI